jgi:hypothetical protein
LDGRSSAACAISSRAKPIRVFVCHRRFWKACASVGNWVSPSTFACGIPSLPQWSSLCAFARPRRLSWTTPASRTCARERFVPTISHLIETFGPSRLLFGSDWPVVKLASPYTTWIQMARALLSHLSGPDQEAIFNGNAARVYRLG